VNSEFQEVSRPHVTVIEAFVILVISFFCFRLTVAVMLVVSALLYLAFPLHHSRRALLVACVLLAVAAVVPVDIYIPRHNGPLMHSEHSGLRFVRVLYGLGAHRRDGGEFISGGCIVGLHDTRWTLVWD
jgi:hypothetical protein